jgi:hypothetical protein
MSRTNNRLQQKALRRARPIYEPLDEQNVSRFWYPIHLFYSIAADCNTAEAARNFAMTNERKAPVFYSGDKPSLTTKEIVKGLLFFPDGSEAETTYAHVLAFTAFHVAAELQAQLQGFKNAQA